MAEIDEFTLLTTRVAVLERLIRSLLRETFSNASDPVQRAREYVERQKQWLETDVRKSPNDPVPVLMAGIYDSIFDPLLGELEKDQRDQDPTSD